MREDKYNIFKSKLLSEDFQREYEIANAEEEIYSFQVYGISNEECIEFYERFVEEEEISYDIYFECAVAVRDYHRSYGIAPMARQFQVVWVDEEDENNVEYRQWLSNNGYYENYEDYHKYDLDTYKLQSGEEIWQYDDHGNYVGKFNY